MHRTEILVSLSIGQGADEIKGIFWRLESQNTERP